MQSLRNFFRFYENSSNVVGYFVALALWAIAYVARLGLVGVLPPLGFPFLTFFPAVMLTAYFFGLGPGLLCSAMSVGTAYWAFMPHQPEKFLGLVSGDAIALCFFTAILLIDCVVLHLLRNSRWIAANREKDLRELTANSPDILTRFDREYRHLFVSAAIERLTGKSASEFIGKTNRELGMPSELCVVWEKGLQSVFVTGKTNTIRFAYAESVFDATLVPEFEPGKFVVSSVLGVTRDVTEIERASQKLREQDSLKDQMLATVAHELRNPLATFGAGIAILERFPEQSPVLTRTISAMKRQTDQMSRLVKDLMDLNRIRANLISLNITTSNLSDILKSAVETSLQLARDKSITIDLRLPDEAMEIQADTGRLVQVFSNLLTNAIKFSAEGATVIVDAVRDGDGYLVKVSDSGAGIEPHMLDSIFEPFVQSTVGHKEQTGLGIGLALVKQLVRLHSGSASASSDGVGKGAAFTIQLPATAFVPNTPRSVA
jgi:PAS domain S-box-containing protein